MTNSILPLALLSSALACAQQTTVNACPLDTQPGGTNFANAMAKGGNISFSPGCGVIHITRTYPVSVRTQISGENRVTLDSTVPLGTLGMFQITGNAELILQQLTLKPTTAFGIVTGQNGNQSRITSYQNHVIGPTLSAFSGAGTISSVQDTFSNISGVALAANNVSADTSQFTSVGTALQSSATATVSASTFTGGSSAVVCESGTLEIIGSHFLNFTNGAVRTWCATTVSNSDFRNNKSDSGGAISVNPLQPGATPGGPQSFSVSLSSTSFTGNSATGPGGAVSIRALPGGAPAIALRQLLFTANTADRGGGLDIQGYVLLGSRLDASAVAFNGNIAAHDGAGFHGISVSGRIARGVFANNKAGGAGGGAGVTMTGRQEITFANSLFVNNSAVSGSAFSGAYGSFVNSTIASNSGTAITALGPQVSLANSIVAGNQINCAGPALINGGHNVQFPGDACNPAIPTADPQLDSLWIPRPANPVLVGGDKTLCAGPDVINIDVWAQHRPRGANCSIGAVEGGMESLVLQNNPGTVLPARQGDFSLTAEPPAVHVAGSTGTAQCTVQVTPMNGFRGQVTFSTSNVPSGMTVSFNGSNLTLVNGPLVTPGPYTLNVTGASGALTHSLPVAVTVDP